MSKKHDDPRGKQKGAQQHAEGQHGERTHERFLEEIQASSTETGADGEQRDPDRSEQHPPDGTHRLFEGRNQSDPAERASEKNRLSMDIDAHGHDRSNFQLPHGRTSHPATPDPKGELNDPGDRG